MDTKGEVAGLLLAAGGGRRLGGRPKALLTYRGRPLVEHAVRALRDGGCARCTWCWAPRRPRCGSGPTCRAACWWTTRTGPRAWAPRCGPASPPWRRRPRPTRSAPSGSPGTGTDRAPGPAPAGGPGRSTACRPPSSAWSTSRGSAPRRSPGCSPPPARATTCCPAWSRRCTGGAGPPGAVRRGPLGRGRVQRGRGPRRADVPAGTRRADRHGGVRGRRRSGGHRHACRPATSRRPCTACHKTLNFRPAKTMLHLAEASAPRRVPAPGATPAGSATAPGARAPHPCSTEE